MAYARHSSNNRRSRNNNRGNRNNGGNNRRPQARLNHVYDSNGPEGRVRGTAAQIVDKYTTLANDANASGNKVLQQSFLQHAEHYQRILNEVQKEVAAANERQAEKKGNNTDKNQRSNKSENKPTEKTESDIKDDKMTDVPGFLAEGSDEKASKKASNDGQSKADKEPKKKEALEAEPA